MGETFSDFKQNFYARIKDLSVLDCEEYNLLKVVLDGLKVDYKSRGIGNQAVFKPHGVVSLLFFAKRIKYFSAIRRARKEAAGIAPALKLPYFLFDNGRAAEDEKGDKVSFYFNKIKRHLGPENCGVIYEAKRGLEKGITINELFMSTLFNSYSRDEKPQIAALKRTYTAIEKLNVFTPDELFNIRVAINKFFDEYRFWRFVLKETQAKFALFEEHYQREGFILALRRKNIKVVELQHGLIAPEDVFYVFPEAVRKIAPKALFPDRLFTYGQYWSDVLSRGFEFGPGQVEVLGVYQELNRNVSALQKKELDDFAEGNKIILVTTQTFLHDYFVEYIQWLSADLYKRGSGVKIVVKIHPAEKPADYALLNGLENVRMMYVNTEYLLSKCSWHVSGYSTTLYDATKYDCRNFSLLIEKCRDYIDTFINEGISQLILKNQNPMDMGAGGAANTMGERHFYEDFEKYKYKLNELDK